MTILFYYLLGVVDTVAILAIMFKLFKLPYWEYYKEILILSLVVAAASYLFRVTVGTATLDMIMQVMMYIGFLVLVIKIRVVKSVIIACAGYSAFAAIQVAFAMVVFMTGVIKTNVATNAFGIGINTIQIGSEILTFAICYTLYRLRWGWSYVIQPPHDFYIKEPLNKAEKNLLVAAVVVVSTFIFSYTAYQHLSFYVVTPVTIGCYACLYYISRVRDFYDARHSRGNSV